MISILQLKARDGTGVVEENFNDFICLFIMTSYKNLYFFHQDTYTFFQYLYFLHLKSLDPLLEANSSKQ